MVDERLRRAASTRFRPRAHPCARFRKPCQGARATTPGVLKLEFRALSPAGLTSTSLQHRIAAAADVVCTPRADWRGGEVYVTGESGKNSRTRASVNVSPAVPGTATIVLKKASLSKATPAGATCPRLRWLSPTSATTQRTQRHRSRWGKDAAPELRMRVVCCDGVQYAGRGRSTVGTHQVPGLAFPEGTAGRQK